jgi:hypothetical protein
MKNVIFTRLHPGWAVKRERENQAGDRFHGTLLHGEKQHNCFLFLTVAAEL